MLEPSRTPHPSEGGDETLSCRDELRGLDRELLTAVQQALKMLAGGKWQNVTTDGNGRQ